MNSLTIFGNLTRAPELREVGKTTIATFGIAGNEFYKTADGERKQRVLFLDCEVWGKLSETVVQYFEKGKKVVLFGSLRMDEWTDKDSGVKRTKIKMNVERFAFADKREDSGESSRPATKRDNKANVEVDDDLPF